MSKHTTAILVALLSALIAFPVWACNSGTVRDAAFQGKRDMHRLCVMGNKDDVSANSIHEKLAAWFQDNSEGLNIRLERVNADDPDIRWERYGLPSAPPSFPVTVLVGTSLFLKESFVVEHWEPAPTSSDLAMLRSSPALDAAKVGLVDVWAVILYSRATQEGADAGQAVLDKVAKRWEEQHAPGIRVAPLDRADPRERILCSFAGIKPSTADWAGVMFGRGRLMGPPLQGAEITEENVERLLSGLMVPCTCLQESIALGIDVPLAWEPRLDRKFAALETAAGRGYQEITFGQQAETLAAQVKNEEGRNVAVAAVIPLALIAVTSVAITAFMIWRVRRHPGATEGS